MNNAEYWEKRLAKIRDNAVKNEKIKAIYRRAYRTTEKDLKKLYDELADMGELTASKLYRSRRFLTLLDELKKQNGDIKSALAKRIKTALKQAFKDTYSLAGEKLGKETAWTVQNSKAAETIINTDWSGKHFSKRIWANTNKLSTDIRRKVTDCVIRGTAKDTAIKQIMKSYDTGYNNAYRLVQTEVARTQNAASVERYKEEGVKKAKWVTAHDERVCPHCGAMEGKIFDIDKVPHIMHPRCHCSVDPVVSSIPGMEDIEIHYRDKQEYGKEITELTKQSNNDIIGMYRRSGNVGAFKHLPEKMTKKRIREVAKEYNISLKGITLEIIADEDWLRSSYTGMTDEPIGLVMFFPNAFESKETLLRTIYHEKIHVKQYQKYGVAYVQNHNGKFEDEAYVFEDKFIKSLKKDGKI